MAHGISAFLTLSPTQVIDLFDTGLLTAFFASVLFVIGYSALAPWWTHKVGWSVVMLDIALGLTLLPTTLHLLFNVSVVGLFFTWYRCLSLFALAAVTLWRLLLVKMSQDEMMRDITVSASAAEPNAALEPVEETE